MKPTQLPSGSWRCRVYCGTDENGKKIMRSVTAPTKTAVLILADKLMYEHEQGILSTIPATMTVGDAVDHYIADRSHILAPKTIREYNCYRRNMFGKLMACKLSALTIQLIQQEINREAEHLATKTLKNCIGLIRPACQEYINLDWRRIQYPMAEKHEISIPTDDEIEILIQASAGTRLEIPILLAVFCGMRRGEISAIDIDKDINYTKHTIRINKDITNDSNGDWIVGKPKATASYRVIEIPQRAFDRIVELKDTYKPMNPGFITSAFTRLCTKLNLKIRFHDLRHYYASTLLSLGVPDMYAMRRMGHSTTHMLKTVYQHIMEDKDTEITKMIDAHFSQKVDTKVDTNTP